MKIAGRISDLRAELEAKSASVGLVPTMGFLHKGHLSLVRRSAAENELTIVSVFVNPTQFGPGEDFEEYPRDLPRDSALAADAGADVLFAPGVQEMYPAGAPAIKIDTGRLGEVGEGRFRPGHFDAVATICAKLFNLVGPTRAYFGEKDAQQLAVIKGMVADLNIPVEIIGCPTVREPDGLAMSSRNARLSPDERKAAPALFRALSAAEDLAAGGERSAGRLVKATEGVVGKEPLLRLQYAEVVDPATFEPVKELAGEALLTAAAFAGDVRLIDHVRLKGTPH